MSRALSDWVAADANPEPRRIPIPIGAADSPYYIEARPIKTARERQIVQKFFATHYMVLEDDDNRMEIGSRIVPGHTGPVPFIEWCWVNLVTGYCLPTQQSIDQDNPDIGLRPPMAANASNTQEIKRKHLDRLLCKGDDVLYALMEEFQGLCGLLPEQIAEVEEELGNSSSGVSAPESSAPTEDAGYRVNPNTEPTGSSGRC